MPFEIVRNDITKMKVDAIVNAANTALQMGGGVCGAIFKAAGRNELQEACDTLGPIQTGQAVITDGFHLPAKHIIHTAGPVYQDGQQGEADLLRSCYINSLKLAQQNGCESVAFPLISSGIYGYPKDQALAVATAAIREFLQNNDMTVYLVVFDQRAFILSEKLLGTVSAYIDAHYVDEHLDKDRRRKLLETETRIFREIDRTSAGVIQPSGTEQERLADADKSGSMSGLEADTIGGYNAMLAKQKAVDGEAYITTVLFDNHYELLHDRINLKAVQPITEKEYYVEGSTALLDAIGRTIDKIGKAQKNTAPDYQAEKVLFVITTDGMENASREYTYDKVKAMVEHHKSKFGWEFIFLGANIDAAETAGRFGIASDRAQNFHADSQGTQLNYAVLSEAICHYRKKSSLAPGWKAEIEEDFVKRRGTR